ncbi:MAG: hypothetical protein ACLUQW_08515, partial [Collinsella sp.]
LVLRDPLKKDCCIIAYKIHPEGAIDEKQTICPECTSGCSTFSALSLLMLVRKPTIIWIRIVYSNVRR